MAYIEQRSSCYCYSVIRLYSPYERPDFGVC